MKPIAAILLCLFLCCAAGCEAVLPGPSPAPVETGEPAIVPSPAPTVEPIPTPTERPITVVEPAAELHSHTPLFDPPIAPDASLLKKGSAPFYPPVEISKNELLFEGDKEPVKSAEGQLAGEIEDTFARTLTGGPITREQLRALGDEVYYADGDVFLKEVVTEYLGAYGLAVADAETLPEWVDDAWVENYDDYDVAFSDETYACLKMSGDMGWVICCLFFRVEGEDLTPCFIVLSCFGRDSSIQFLERYGCHWLIINGGTVHGTGEYQETERWVNLDTMRCELSYLRSDVDTLGWSIANAPEFDLIYELEYHPKLMEDGSIYFLVEGQFQKISKEENYRVYNGLDICTELSLYYDEELHGFYTDVAAEDYPLHPSSWSWVRELGVYPEWKLAAYGPKKPWGVENIPGSASETPYPAPGENSHELILKEGEERTYLSAEPEYYRLLLEGTDTPIRSAKGELPDEVEYSFTRPLEGKPFPMEKLEEMYRSLQHETMPLEEYFTDHLATLGIRVTDEALYKWGADEFSRVEHTRFDVVGFSDGTQYGCLELYNGWDEPICLLLFHVDGNALTPAFALRSGLGVIGTADDFYFYEFFGSRWLIFVSGPERGTGFSQRGAYFFNLDTMRYTLSYVLSEANWHTPGFRYADAQDYSLAESFFCTAEAEGDNAIRFTVQATFDKVNCEYEHNTEERYSVHTVVTLYFDEELKQFYTLVPPDQYPLAPGNYAWVKQTGVYPEWTVEGQTFN